MEKGNSRGRMLDSVEGRQRSEPGRSHSCVPAAPEGREGKVLEAKDPSPEILTVQMDQGQEEARADFPS